VSGTLLALGFSRATTALLGNNKESRVGILLTWHETARVERLAGKRYKRKGRERKRRERDWFGG
jgi:hypothetical protein